MTNESERPIVKVGGMAIPDALYDDLSLLVVKQSVQVPDMFTMRFLDPQFEIFDSGAFALADDVELSFARGDSIETICVASVTAISVESSPDGIHELVIEGRVSDGTLHFKRQANDNTKTILEWPDGLLSFDLRFSASEAIEKPTAARGADSSTQKPIVSTPTVTAAGAATSPSATVTSEQVDARGVALGNPFMRAGSEVKLEGLGIKLSGNYLLSGVDHVYRAGERYVSRFRASGHEADSRLTDDAVSLDAPQRLTSMRKDAIRIEADDEITIIANAKGITIKGGSIKIEASKDLSLIGTNVSIEGRSSVKIEGEKTDVKASGMLNMEAGGIAKVQGSMVQLG